MTMPQIQQEKLSVIWHSYSDHLKNMMSELMINEDFADLTIITEDKKQVKANINILSTCSPVLKDILKKENNSNQIMYLMGVQYSVMESLMQFIYLGEATFYEERMSEFLAVAKSLKIKQLCNAETESIDEPLSCGLVTSTESFEEKTVTYDQIEIQDPHDRQDTTQRSLTVHIQSKHEGVKYACDKCGHQFTHKSDLTRHIQTKHEAESFQKHHKSKAL